MLLMFTFLNDLFITGVRAGTPLKCAITMLPNYPDWMLHFTMFIFDMVSM